MVELALSVIDRIIDLLRIREDRFDRRVRDIHKPILDDFRAVHTDYVSMFNHVVRILDGRADNKSNAPKLSSKIWNPSHNRAAKAADYLRNRRESFQVIRQRLRNVPNQVDLRQYTDQEKIFLSHVYSYFPSMNIMGLVNLEYPGGMPLSSPSSYMLGEFEFARLVANPNLSQLRSTILGILNDLTINAQNVERAYADLLEELPGKA
jgi:hypothetical protein